MRHGTEEISKTRKGDREIISVSLPIAVYEAMAKVCEEHDLNRSAMIASAIADHLRGLGVRVGEP